MAVTIYGPSAGAPAVTAATGAGWTFTSGNVQRLAGDISNTTSPNVTKGDTVSRQNSYSTLLGQWIYGPLAAQTISGTVDAKQTAASGVFINFYHMRIAIWLATSAGAFRSQLLAGTTDPALVFYNTSFSQISMSGIALTSQSATAGDYLVLETGAITDGNMASPDTPFLGLGGTRNQFTFSQSLQLYNPTANPSIIWLGKPQPKRS